MYDSRTFGYLFLAFQCFCFLKVEAESEEIFKPCLLIHEERSDPVAETYRLIRLLPFDDHGWFTNEIPLKACLLEKPIMTVIEVGCWLGSSTRFIAQTIPENGRVYAIDSWRGLSTPTPGELETYENEKLRLQTLYWQFLSNVKHAGLEKKIIPIRMLSEEAVHALDIQADLIYIDACHEEEAVYQDILEWYKHLAPGGTMCGDDWNWESVRRAVLRAAVILEKDVFSDDNFWRMY